MSLINGFKGAIKGVQRAREKREGRASLAPSGATNAANAVNSDHMYCTMCGHSGDTATVTPGSIWIELILWMCFLVPGLIYSSWRHNKRHESCEKCGSTAIIPADSPRALQLAKSI